MTSETRARPLFRSSALEAYVRTHERSVLPRLVRPRMFAALWLLFALAAAGAAGAWQARVPSWASGTAVVLGAPAGGDTLRIAAFFPPEMAGSLRVGAPMMIEVTRGRAVRTRVGAAGSGVISPARAAAWFGLQGAATAVAREPRAVALASLRAPPAGPPAAAYRGSVFAVRVQVGDRRVLTLLLPGRGR